MNNLACFLVGLLMGLVLGAGTANASHLAIPVTLCDPDCRETTLHLWDGDTFVIGAVEPQAERIRIIGMDTPEVGYYAGCDCEERLGQIARQRLATLLQRGEVRLIRSERRDRWSRTLAGIVVEGEDVGTVLIREGLAREYDGGKREEWCQ